MQVSSISLFQLHSLKGSKSHDNKIYHSSSQLLANDTFVKNNSAIAFKGKLSEETKEKVLGSLLLTGFFGAEFLIGLGIHTALTKGSDPEDIFLSDGTYIGNVHDMAFHSDKLYVDGNDGIFQAKGTGIDIRPERFDYVDPKLGVYKNFEKGIDINLKEHKYIDPENGIFVDPDKHIAAAIGDDSMLHSITVPSFGDCIPHWATKYMGGSFDRMTRAEFIDKFHDTPEHIVESHKGSWTGFGVYVDGGEVRLLPNDNRSVIQKILTYLNPIDKRPYDTSKDYDIYGREIVPFWDGQKYKDLPIDESIKSLLEKYNITKEADIHKAVSIIEECRLGNYIKHYYPDYSKFLPAPQLPEFEAFMNHSKNDSYNIDEAHKTLEKMAEDGSYCPEPNSEEAINFLNYQKAMLDSNEWTTAMIEPNTLINPDVNIDTPDTVQIDTNSNQGNPDFLEALSTLYKDFIGNSGV